jgi:hypothetical protein
MTSGGAQAHYIQAAFSTRFSALHGRSSFWVQHTFCTRKISTLFSLHFFTSHRIATIDEQLDELKVKQAIYEGELVRKQDMLERTTASVMQLQDQNSKIEGVRNSR